MTTSPRAPPGRGPPGAALRRHPVLAAATVIVLAATALSTAEAAHDLHLLLEAVGA
ncbi:hypothetical protein PH213_37000 [Streptomyces sp. SRF1]|uniref:hypothetical protein n=1 Tax=Streptomyces sp. SRF1 TaxID=1549642 RepID=UPI0025B19084|nr:hypothetical protein [Streptomyces sp. SRF1]MDN3060028.1 hypothetical protein [Streptomyces sp. SRF1]